MPVNIDVQGDYILRLYHNPVGKPGQLLCSVTIHSGFGSLPSSDASLPPNTYRAPYEKKKKKKEKKKKGEKKEK